MMIVVSYDVSVSDREGRKRLCKLAKECQNYGQRVQNSLFEMTLDHKEFHAVKEKLVSLIDPEKDSLRFYYLGNSRSKKVEHFGVNKPYDPDGVIII